MTAIKKKRKAFVDQEYCVACGVVLRFAPLGQFKSGKVWLHR